MYCMYGTYIPYIFVDFRESHYWLKLRAPIMINLDQKIKKRGNI